MSSTHTFSHQSLQASSSGLPLESLLKIITTGYIPALKWWQKLLINFYFQRVNLLLVLVVQYPHLLHLAQWVPESKVLLF